VVFEREVDKAPISLRVDGKFVTWKYQGIYTFKNERLWSLKYEAREPTRAG
jgi:hypothetical protein